MEQRENEDSNVEQVVIHVCGDRGTGKTSVCSFTAALLSARGWHVGGILAPSERDEEGYPWLVHTYNLDSGETRVLASRERGSRSPFLFNEETISWSTDILNSLANSSVHAGYGIQDRKEAGCSEPSFPEAKAEAVHPLWPHRAVFIDEIGPRELVERSGYLPGLKSILKSGYPRVVITTRNSLADSLMSELRQTPCMFQKRKTIHFMPVNVHDPREPDVDREARMRAMAQDLAAMIMNQ